MSGKNESLLDLPPGLNRTVSQYTAGRSWWAGNLVRWFNRTLLPIGGWVLQYTFPAVANVLPAFVQNEPIRKAHSWRDLLKMPWAAYGAANRLWATAVNADGTYTFYNITPSSLGYNPGGAAGYGSGLYGKGPYGISSAGSITQDANSLWSMDNFGKMLVAVASQDGRLCIWDPVAPTTLAAPIAEAPVDNTLVIVTDEEFLMVLGGKNNPRRVKWASQRTYTDWTPTALNSAGGFDLQSNGVIIGACRVPGGILVITDTDAHLLEYVGKPFYYGRRRISTECELVSPNALLATSFGAVWMGKNSFWSYNGAVSRLPASVELDVFYESNLTQPQLVHGGVNQFAQELWWFYPSEASPVPNRYVAFGYDNPTGPYWTLGEMGRTAWLNPVWQAKPIGVYDQDLFLQETGETANGAPRLSYAETGALEVSEGDTSVRIDRVYMDFTDHEEASQPVKNLELTFKLRQAPSAQPREYGPVSVDQAKGYAAVRMRARQVSMRVSEVSPGAWSMGKVRLRIKQAGVR